MQIAIMADLAQIYNNMYHILHVTLLKQTCDIVWSKRSGWGDAVVTLVQNTSTHCWHDLWWLLQTDVSHPSSPASPLPSIHHTTHITYSTTQYNSILEYTSYGMV